MREYVVTLTHEMTVGAENAAQAMRFVREQVRLTMPSAAGVNSRKERTSWYIATRPAKPTIRVRRKEGETR